jgi:hypothetical protein
MEEKSAAFFWGDFRACSVFSFFPFEVQTPSAVGIWLF